MSIIAFYAQFVGTKVGVNSLTVTWDIERITRVDGTRSALVTGGANSITVGRRGLYGYILADADLTLYDYVATAITDSASVDQQEVPALWTRWTEDANPVGIRSAVGMASANLDTQIAALGTLANQTILLTRLSAARAGYLDYLAGWTSTIFAQIAGVLWTYATRTLTSTAAATTATITGSALAITHGVTYSDTVSGLTIPATWSKIYFTIKRDKTTNTDAESVLQIVESATPAATDGILYLNGAPINSTIRDYGSLTVSQAAGTIVITLDDALDLSTLDGIYTYDLKALKSDGTSVQLSGSGSVTIGFSETRSIE